MPATSRMRDNKTETDIAVLQVELSHLREDVADMKNSIKNLHDAIDESSKNTTEMLNGMRRSADAAHSELNKKISSLEKWRYMIMGAGIVIGYTGVEVIAKLFQAH